MSLRSCRGIPSDGVEHPEELAEEFAASVAHFAPYANLNDHFYPPERAKREYAADLKRTNDLVLRLQEQDTLIPVDAASRLTQHVADAAVGRRGLSTPMSSRARSSAATEVPACSARIGLSPTLTIAWNSRMPWLKGNMPQNVLSDALNISHELFRGRRRARSLSLPSAAATSDA